jgi:2-oxoglutarate dehydrogenase E1 component
MDAWQEFTGPNIAYLLDLYERFRADPTSVDETTRTYFAAHPPPSELLSESESPKQSAAESISHPLDYANDPGKISAVLKLAQAIRWYGHWASPLDPLGSPPPGDPSLLLETYGLSENDLQAFPASLIGGVAGESARTASEAIQYLRRIYSGTVGHDYLQIRNAVERDWLREAAESQRFSVEAIPVDPLIILRRLTEVEVFEHFLQRTFAAKTRFSIEGLDVLVLLLDVIVTLAVSQRISNVLLGTAHRGRLNLLAHVLKKPVDQILAEFKDPLRHRNMQTQLDGWRGDVKYHAGAIHGIDTDNDPNTLDLFIQMAPNPSHLESINPVVEGMARAAGTRTDRPGPAVFDPAVTLPVLIHGDAAFPGQGVVAETLNLYHLQGYTTGGTIHIIANNQIGFTAEAHESRSTLFASDLAKGYRIPIIHVNADDPAGVIMAARTAFAYRMHFHNDFLIDLIGYRRLGHNEGDEPSFTQPQMYQMIAKHPSVRKIWADRLVENGHISPEIPEKLYRERMDTLQATLEKLDPNDLREPIPSPPPPGAARKVRTAVSLDRLRSLNRELQRLPETFRLHPRLARIRQRRETILEDASQPTIDWSAAEELAFASILEDGIPIRLTGQDSERGTFSHRHAVLHDVETGERYIPLQSIPQAKASFEIHNSPLSEYAVLGFEFGYNIQAPNQLVIWEAQYGDFVNNAQTVIDEFVASARDKWGQLSSLVLLLPHGYEGQGPDHSSGRPERFLGLAAEKNLRVVNCTTAANYFHVLRRQAALLAVDPLPLVVMTPKSLLRHPLVSSPLKDFTQGAWQPVIDRVWLAQAVDTPSAELPPAAEIQLIVLCSGKIYVDLVTSDLYSLHPEIAIVRIEQLAPFPIDDMTAVIQKYPAAKMIRWVQEEPENMGAWDFLKFFLHEILPDGMRLDCVARNSSASPAEGSSNQHAFNQRSLIENAFSGTHLPEKIVRGPARVARANQK